jgi:hypothetical protein
VQACLPRAGTFAWQPKGNEKATERQGHRHVAKGGHGLAKVKLGTAMLYLSMPCGRPPLKQLYGHFRGGSPQCWLPAAVVYPHGYPTLYAAVPGAITWQPQDPVARITFVAVNKINTGKKNQNNKEAGSIRKLKAQPFSK